MRLGSLSAKYESNGKPGTVSTGYGDAGGVSYGTYQLASNAGSVKSFVNWLKSRGHSYGNALGQYTPGSAEFTSLWKEIAAVDPGGFEQLQHDYIQYAYYEPAVAKLKRAYFNIENHTDVMKDVVWSRAVQYGTGYIVEMFQSAVKFLGYPNLSYVDASNFDADMIKSVYLNVCKTPEWTNGSPSLRTGLYNRFDNECKDALARI